MVLIVDWFAISCSWILAFYMRFYLPIIPVTKGIPEFITYLSLLTIMLPLWYMVFKTFGLYRPRRISSKFAEVIDISKGTTIAILILISLTFFVGQYAFSRLTFLYFWVICMVVLCIERIVFRELLRFIRRRGYNLRHAIIVGTGSLALDVTDRVRSHPELGIQIVGLLSENSSQIGNEIKGIKILDNFGNIRKIVADQSIDMILIALPLSAHERLKTILSDIGDETVSIMLIPDLIELATLRGGIGEFEGMPIISLRDTPLYGWNLVTKRVMDIVLSLTIILATFTFDACCFFSSQSNVQRTCVLSSGTHGFRWKDFQHAEVQDNGNSGRKRDRSCLGKEGRFTKDDNWRIFEKDKHGRASSIL